MSSVVFCREDILLSLLLLQLGLIGIKNRLVENENNSRPYSRYGHK